MRAIKISIFIGDCNRPFAKFSSEFFCCIRGKMLADLNTIPDSPVSQVGFYNVDMIPFGREFITHCFGFRFEAERSYLDCKAPCIRPGGDDRFYRRGFGRRMLNILWCGRFGHISGHGRLKRFFCRFFLFSVDAAAQYITFLPAWQGLVKAEWRVSCGRCARSGSRLRRVSRQLCLWC